MNALKTISRAVAFVVVVLLAMYAVTMATSAHAGDTENCTGWGEFAMMVAEARDYGMPMLEVLEAIEDISTPLHVQVVESVYAEPHASPYEEGNRIFGICMGYIQ